MGQLLVQILLVHPAMPAWHFCPHEGNPAMLKGLATCDYQGIRQGLPNCRGWTGISEMMFILIFNLLEQRNARPLSLHNSKIITVLQTHLLQVNSCKKCKL